VAPCQEQLLLVSDDEAAPLFDVHDEPVHCPAERCKLHRQCFGWLAVTAGVRLANFTRQCSYSFKVRSTKIVSICSTIPRGVA